MQVVKDKIADKAAIKGLKNAYDLAESAEQLSSLGKIGAAVSLLVIACEELSKARHYRSISYGIITVDESKLGDRYVFSPKVMREHELKHMDSAGSGLASLVMSLAEKNRDKIDEFISANNIDLSKGLLSKEDQKKFDSFTESLFESDKEYQKEFKELQDLMRRMEELKERGLYVDVKDGNVLSPDDTKESDYIVLRKHFDKLILDYGKYIDGSATSRFADLSARFLADAAKRQKEPMFYSYRRGDLNRGVEKQ